MNRVDFFRRRQFVLGPEYVEIEGWKRYEIAIEHCLTVHPDLQVHLVKSTAMSLTLLGYFIDPYEPSMSETDILSRMLAELQGTADIIRGLERLSGRFVMIVNLEDKRWLFHDAAGLRQVLYCKDKNGRIWCASQAETLAERLGFSFDEEVLEYRNARMFRSGRNEFWLVNDRTAYKEVSHLLPNHFLDLIQGKAVRFWPTKNCIPPLSVEEGIALTMPILKNSIAAMSKKHELKMGISAGMDSRKTLAASKDVRDKIAYFTIEHNLSGGVSLDVKIPSRLLAKLGLKHQIIRQLFMDKEFRSYYEASATFARESKGNIAYTLYANLGTNYTVLSSNVSEISQCNYWLPKSKLNGEGLAIITGLYHPLTIAEFGKWLQGASGACEEAKLNILALFHWEQRAGRWATAGFGEYDIVHESFTPYNNRLLNSHLLGISERYRRNRMSYVGLRQIRAIWPEALKEPINPGDTLGIFLREFARRNILHRFITPWIPIYEYLKYRRKKRKVEMRIR